MGSFFIKKRYPPGNDHIIPQEKEHHLRGYVSSQEAILNIILGTQKPTKDWQLSRDSFHFKVPPLRSKRRTWSKVWKARHTPYEVLSNRKAGGLLLVGRCMGWGSKSCTWLFGDFVLLHRTCKSKHSGERRNDELFGRRIFFRRSGNEELKHKLRSFSNRTLPWRLWKMIFGPGILGVNPVWRSSGESIKWAMKKSLVV